MNSRIFLFDPVILSRHFYIVQVLLRLLFAKVLCQLWALWWSQIRWVFRFIHLRSCVHNSELYFVCWSHSIVQVLNFHIHRVSTFRHASWDSSLFQSVLPYQVWIIRGIFYVFTLVSESVMVRNVWREFVRKVCVIASKMLLLKGKKCVEPLRVRSLVMVSEYLVW